MASAKRKRNTISNLRREDGEVVTTQQQLCGVATNYFEHLFENGGTASSAGLEHISHVVNSEDNNMLLAPFHIAEFKKALFSMHSDKAPGPDGLNPAFYKRFWHLCEVELYHAATTWLNNGSFPLQIMDTTIVLIPKKDNPETMRDLRPISLCNVIYKIISKVLANRLKPLLPKCISQEQSAFCRKSFHH
jgi:hypothetical protein